MNKTEKNSEKLIVSCPTCQKNIVWNALHPFKPFCSERCKLIDLGEWASDGRVIPGNQVH